jgi:predicted O-methyltransferase YrrM
VRDLLNHAVRKIKSTSHRIRWQLRQWSPTEKAFKQIWSSVASIEGLLVSPDQERWFFTTARSLPDRAVIVEIGSFKGRSTCCFAYGCRGSAKHIFAIDTFAGNDSDFKEGKTFQGGSYFDIFSHNLESRGLAHFVTPIRGLSTDAAKSWRQPIDLLFIDGSHVYEDVLADFENFLPHVKPGGIVAFHDVDEGWSGPWRVWREIASRRLTDTNACATLAYGRKRRN